jgi:hypothetical protein
MTNKCISSTTLCKSRHLTPPTGASKKKYTRRNYYTSRKDQYLNTIKTDGVRVQHNKYLMRGILQQPLGVLQALFVADA